MSRKGHYPGGSTIIRIYPTAGGSKPVKKGALSLWVKQFEAEKKAGLVKRMAPEPFDAVPSVSVDVSLEAPGKPNRVRKKRQKQSIRNFMALSWEKTSNHSTSSLTQTTWTRMKSFKYYVN